MAKSYIFLDSGDDYTDVLPQNAVVYGADGTESVTIPAGATGIVLDQNIEQVNLPGNVDAFTYQQAGNTLMVFSGSDMVATIPVQQDGTQLVFSNGSVDLSLVSGNLLLGGTDVPETPGPVVPVDIDPVGVTFTITSDVTAGVATEEGNVITYTITPSGITDKAYNFTLSTVGDTVTGVASASANDFSPAAKTISFAAGTSTPVTVTQTVVNDANTEGLEAYKTYLLDSTSAVVGSVTGTINDPVSSPTGTTYTLTTATDTVTGTTGNDKIIGVQSATVGTGTYTTGDIINGMEGEDTLDVILDAVAAVPVTTVTNVETLNLRSANAGNAFNMANNTDKSIVQINENLSTASLAVNNIGKTGVNVAVSNITTGGNNSTFNWVGGALSGASDEIKLTLDNAVGAGAARHTINLNGGGATQGFETVNIMTTGSASRLAALNVNDNAAATTLKTLNITGDKDLSIAGLVDFSGAAGTGTIDASAFTGKLTLSNLGNGDIVTVTGGTGDDTFLFGGGLTATDSVNGGDGSDTLGANLFTDLQNAVNGGRISNIEAIQVQNAPTASSTMDVSKAGNVNIIGFSGGFGAAGIISTVQNLQDNATVNVTANGTGTVQANIKDATLAANTTNTMTVNIGTSTDNAVLAVGTLDAPGVETITVNALGTAGTTLINTLTITNNNFLKNLMVTGTEGFTATYAGGTLVNYDASASTGVQTTTAGMFSNTGASVTGGSAADTLVTGIGNDTILGGSGNDTITGGLGADRITTGAGSDTINLSYNGNVANATNTSVDFIADFTLGSGGDVLDMTNLGNANNPVLNGVASKTVVASLTSALPAAAASPSDGQAELIILDSASITASDSQALNDLLFNLGGSAAYGNVLVAYSATNGGDVRLATATIAGGDITNVVDTAVLQGITTSTLNSGFAAANLTGFGTPGGNFTITSGNLTTGTAGNDTFTALNAAAFNGATVDGAGGVDTIVVSGATGAAMTLGGNTGGNPNTLLNPNSFANVTLQAGTTVGAFTLDNSLTNLAVANTSAATGATVALGTGSGNSFNGVNTVADILTLGAGTQTATLDTGDTVNGSVAGATVSFSGNLNITGAAAGSQLDPLVGNYTGTGANDALVVAAGATGTTPITTGTLTGVETLNLGAVGGALAVTLGAGVTGLTALTADTTGGSVTFTGTGTQLSGITTFTNTNGTATFNLTVSNAGGILDISGDTIAGGAPDVDVISFQATGANQLITDSTNLGRITGNVVAAGGTDSLILTSAGANAVAITKFNAFETLTAQAGNAAVNITDAGLAVARIINGNAANNTIDVGISTAVKTIDISQGGVDTLSTAAVAAAGTGRMVVTGFTAGGGTGADILDLNAATTSAVTAMQVQGSNPGGAFTFTTAAAGVLELSYDFSTVGDISNDLTGAALLAGLGGVLSVSAATNTGYIIAYQNNNAYIYYVLDAAGGTIDSGDIGLVGVLNGVAVGAIQAANIM